MQEIDTADVSLSTGDICGLWPSCSTGIWHCRLLPSTAVPAVASFHEGVRSLNLACPLSMGKSTLEKIRGVAFRTLLSGPHVARDRSPSSSKGMKCYPSNSMTLQETKTLPASNRSPCWTGRADGVGKDFEKLHRVFQNIAPFANCQHAALPLAHPSSSSNRDCISGWILMCNLLAQSPML